MDTYKKAIISYIDILGFKNIVNNSSNPSEVSNILRFIMNFIKEEQQRTNMICNTSVINFSDFIIHIIPVESIVKIEDNIVQTFRLQLDVLARIQHWLLTKNLTLRGGITIGNIFHSNEFMFGSGLNSVVTLESKVSKPIIAVDQSLFPYLLSVTKETNTITAIEQNYLRTLENSSIGFIDYLKLLDFKFLEKWFRLHKTVIENNLKTFHSPNIIEKYLWLGEYHNISILDCGYKKINDIRDELLIDKKLLSATSCKDKQI